MNVWLYSSVFAQRALQTQRERFQFLELVALCCLFYGLLILFPTDQGGFVM